MNARSGTERILDAYLAPETDRLADRVIDAALDQVARTPQRRALRVPWRFAHMPALTRTTSIAAVALVAVVGAGSVLYLTSNRPGTGATVPAASATPGAATPSPTPSQRAAASPRTALQGLLNPGTYAYQATWATDPALTVTFTLTDSWQLFGNSLLPEHDGYGGGIAIQFLDVTTLNRDPCHWRGSDGDVDAGTTVGDLVAALDAETAYATSDPVDVTIGGYSGQRVDIVGPTEPFASKTEAATPACDGEVMRLWSTREHGEIGVYLQGPANRWQANILDVNGARLVVVGQDFPDTSAANRARLDAVIASMVIEP